MNTPNTRDPETNTQHEQQLDADQSENRQPDTNNDGQQKKAKLTPEQKTDFNKLKKIIGKYLHAHSSSAEALSIIIKDKLYLPTYKSPVEFLMKTYDICRSHSNRMVKYAQVHQSLSKTGIKPTERDVRELLRLPKSEQFYIWQAFSQLENSERKFKKLVDLVSAAKLASRVASNSERATQNPHQDNVASTRRSENRTGEALEPAIKLKADQFFAEAIQGLDADKKSEVLKYLQEKVQEPQQAVTEIAPPASVDAAAEGQPPEIVQA